MLGALSIIFSPQGLLAMWMGLVMGIVFGAIPGLTSTLALSLLVPVTFGMDPSIAMLIMVGSYCGAEYGGSISAILLGVPGTPAAAATKEDGHPMMLKGQAWSALRMSAWASAWGGLFSAVVLTLMGPALANLALKFGPPEFFVIGIFGMSVICSLDEKSMMKALISGGFGIFLATIGILVTEAMADCGMEWLRQNGYEVRYGRGTTPEALIEDLQGCQGVITRLAEMTAGVLEKAPELRVIARHGAGVDSVDLDYCRAHNIQVLRNVGTNSTAVAEFALTLILACAKSLLPGRDMYRAGEFSKARKTLEAHELAGKTLGLLGMGHIGQIVAQICGLGFGMRVLAFDPYADPASVPGYVTLSTNREEIFREADFVSIHVPATAETRNSVGAEAFSMMKPTAFLINSARGSVIDEAALIEALQNGVIAGAGLDVTVLEPAKADNPLFTMENVILTPHCAGSTTEAKEKASMAAAKGCHAILSGLPVESPAVLV